MKILLCIQNGMGSYLYGEYCIRSLSDALFKAQHTVALCACDSYKDNHFSYYSAPQPRKKFSVRRKPVLCYEEDMYRNGALSYDYLCKDFNTIQNAIHEFKPDFLIEFERPAAILAAKINHLNVISIVLSNAFLNRSVDPAYLYDINRVLSEHKQVQILKLNELYQLSQRRITLEPCAFCRFKEEEQVEIYGGLADKGAIYKPAKKIGILFPETSLSRPELKKLIKEAFLGSSYDVYLYMPFWSGTNTQNFHFLKNCDLSALKDAALILHDGSDAITEECFRYGIPQEILTDGNYRHDYNGIWVSRLHVGRCLRDYEISLASIYETYRAIVTDAKYRKKAGHYARLTNTDKSISDFVQSLD